MAQHIRKIDINTYRGINNLSLDNLGDINILVGDNNSGKTSVLESILLLSNPSSFGNVVTVSRMRDQFKRLSMGSLSFYDSFICMFNMMKEKKRIDISGEIYYKRVSIQIQGEFQKVIVDKRDFMSKLPFRTKKDINEDSINQSEEIEGFNGELISRIESKQMTFLGAEPTVQPISYHKYISRVAIGKEKPIINTRFISTIEHIVENTFSNITRESQVTKEVVEVLKIFDENIINLKLIQDDDNRVIQIVEHKLLGNTPLSVYGDGIKKVIALANGIVGSENGVLLIDEIETSIHKSAMKEVFSWIVEACKRFNVQLFFTTHSIEAVDDILNSNSKIIEENMARVITLKKKDDVTVGRILTGEKVVQLRNDYEAELR